MEFLRSVAQQYLKEQNEDDPFADFGMDQQADPSMDMDMDMDMDEFGGDDMMDIDQEIPNTTTDDDGNELDGDQAEQNLEDANEDPDRQGIIRTVAGAHLVYKRRTEENTFDELWIYNVGKNSYQQSMHTRKAILAGTDIKPGQTHSEDNKQHYEIWTAGNAELIKITGLPQ